MTKNFKENLFSGEAAFQVSEKGYKLHCTHLVIGTLSRYRATHRSNPNFNILDGNCDIRQPPWICYKTLSIRN
jgi:hypothetical protein